MNYISLILDVGCGKTKRGTVGVDLEGKPDVKCDAHHMPFKACVFDGCYALAVLEHVDNPRMVLAEIWRVLKPRKWLKILVPTDSRLISDQIRCLVTFRIWKALQYYEDAKAQHKWQYSEKGLCRICESANFRIIKVAYPQQPFMGKNWKIGKLLSKLKLTFKPHIVVTVTKK